MITLTIITAIATKCIVSMNKCFNDFRVIPFPHIHIHIQKKQYTHKYQTVCRS